MDQGTGRIFSSAERNGAKLSMKSLQKNIELGLSWTGVTLSKYVIENLQ